MAPGHQGSDCGRQLPPLWWGKEERSCNYSTRKLGGCDSDRDRSRRSRVLYLGRRRGPVGWDLDLGVQTPWAGVHAEASSADIGKTTN